MKQNVEGLNNKLVLKKNGLKKDFQSILKYFLKFLRNYPSIASTGAVSDAAASKRPKTSASVA